MKADEPVLPVSFLAFVAQVIDPSHCSFLVIGFRQEVCGNKKQPCNECGHDRARDDRRDEKRILLLSHQSVRQAVERRNRPKRQAGGHQQRIVPALLGVLTEKADKEIEAENLRRHFPHKQREKHERRGKESGQGHECSGAKKVKGREKSHGQGSQSTNPMRIPRGASREHHARKIRRQHRFASRLQRQRAQSKQRQHDPFRPDRSRTMRIVSRQPGGHVRQHHQRDNDTHDKHKSLIGKRRKE